MPRPNLYESLVGPRLKEIKDWAAAGATNKEISQALGVGYSNFCKYISENKELKDSLQEGRRTGIPAVKLALYKRAVGVEYTESRTVSKEENGEEVQSVTEVMKKKALPDVRAIEIYLRNYDPDYRDHDAQVRRLKEREVELKERIANRDDDFVSIHTS